MLTQQGTAEAKIGELTLALKALQDEVKAMRENATLTNLAVRCLLTTVADMQDAVRKFMKEAEKNA